MTVRKYLLYALLVSIVAILVNELFWSDKTSSDWVIIGLTVAIVLQVGYLLRRQLRLNIRPLHIILVLAGLWIMAVGGALLLQSYPR